MIKLGVNYCREIQIRNTKDYVLFSTHRVKIYSQIKAVPSTEGTVNREQLPKYQSKPEERLDQLSPASFWEGSSFLASFHFHSGQAPPLVLSHAPSDSALSETGPSCAQTVSRSGLALSAQIRVGALGKEVLCTVASLYQSSFGNRTE